MEGEGSCGVSGQLLVPFIDQQTANCGTCFGPVTSPWASRFGSPFLAVSAGVSRSLSLSVFREFAGRPSLRTPQLSDSARHVVAAPIPRANYGPVMNMFKAPRGSQLAKQRVILTRRSPCVTKRRGALDRQSRHAAYMNGKTPPEDSGARREKGSCGV